MNKFETLAIGLKNNIYDKKMVRDAFGRDLKEIYNKSKPWINYIRNTNPTVMHSTSLRSWQKKPKRIQPYHNRFFLFISLCAILFLNGKIMLRFLSIALVALALGAPAQGGEGIFYHAKLFCRKTAVRWRRYAKRWTKCWCKAQIMWSSNSVENKLCRRTQIV